MPNHFLMVGLAATTDMPQDIDKLRKANLCELCMPMPEALRSIVATNPPVRYRHKETHTWHRSCNSPTGDDLANYDRIVVDDDVRQQLRGKYDADNWLDWCCNNWGTKWGTYDTHAEMIHTDGSPVIIRCECAWGPPNPECMREINRYLERHHGLTEIKWIGHDPSDGSTHVIEVAKS